MTAQTSRYLRISSVILIGVLLACAGDARFALVRAQTSQSQSSQAQASQNASPPQPATTAIPASTAPAPASADVAEMTTQEASVPLRVLVNLVPVRVIVRDAKGNAVATFHKEDFQLFQDGKPQIISNFSVETAGVRCSSHRAGKRRARSCGSAWRACCSSISASLAFRGTSL